MTQVSHVRTRMAPSPTGEYHIGHIRTVLFNYAWAKKNNGQFVLRIEDTDRTRFVEGATERIAKDIRDYGLIWDEGIEVGGPHEPYFQSQRLDIYKKYALQLVEGGHAYYCFCSSERLSDLRKRQQDAKQLPKYDRHCLALSKDEIQIKLDAGEPYVIRLRVPDDRTITFNDVILGDITFESSSLDDQVLLKSDGFPTYHLAVVVDDHLMEITHVIRGNEWISSTPKHVLLYEAFGWTLPMHAHLPVFLDPGGEGKMSKRKGSVSARSFLDEGYLPEALLNYLMLLGWNSGSDKEVYSLQEFVQAFDIKDLNKSNPRFTYEKLDWFNGHYIRSKENSELLELAKPFTKYTLTLEIISLIKERISKLTDIDELVKFFFEKPGSVEGLNKEFLQAAIEAVEKDTDLAEMAKSRGWKLGDFFMDLRLAICGQKITPPLNESMAILGKEEVLVRLKQNL